MSDSDSCSESSRSESMSESELAVDGKMLGLGDDKMVGKPKKQRRGYVTKDPELDLMSEESGIGSMSDSDSCSESSRSESMSESELAVGGKMLGLGDDKMVGKPKKQRRDDNEPLLLVPNAVFDEEDEVRNLGVILDRKLSIENHTKNITKVNFFILGNKIHHLFSLISSLLDNCNALLVGESAKSINGSLQQPCCKFKKL
ncbi:unnamed protein product [Boreogadus saida]